MTTTATDRETSPARYAGHAAWWAGMLSAWSVQYTVVVPIVWCMRLLSSVARFAMRAGLWAIVLLCLPIIGWAILAVILLLRSPSERPPRRPAAYARPWLLDRYRAWAAA